MKDIVNVSDSDDASDTESELLGLKSTTPLSPSHLHLTNFDAMVAEVKKNIEQNLLDRLEEEHTRTAISRVGTDLVEKVNRLKRKRNDLLENVDKVLEEQNRLRLLTYLAMTRKLRHKIICPESISEREIEIKD